MGRGTASTIFWYIKLFYWCRAPTKNLCVANIMSDSVVILILEISLNERMVAELYFLRYTQVMKLPTGSGKPHPVLTDIPLLNKERERFLHCKKRG